jgi:hypothetical protein
VLLFAVGLFLGNSQIYNVGEGGQGSERSVKERPSKGCAKVAEREVG